MAVFLLHYVLGFFVEPVRAALRQFFIDPSELFRDDSQLFFGVVLLDLGLAVAFGFVFGSAIASRLLKKTCNTWLKWRNKEPNTIARGQSAWITAFDRKPDYKVIVGAQLKSGAWVQGVLDSFSRSGDEIPDRAFTLSGEIYYRMAGSDNVHRLDYHGALIVQASEIDYLTVGYEEPDNPEASDDPAGDPE
jgi:hypothetical protein